VKPRQLLMGAALMSAAGLAFFGDKTPSSDLAEPAERHGAAAASPARNAAASAAADSASASAGAAEPAILALHARADLIGEAGEATFDGKDGLFLSQNWMPPPPVVKPGPPPPPPAPVAPPLPFAYLGKAASDGSWEVYLVRANKTYVVRQQTLIDGIYRIETIAPPNMTITYLPLNQVQQLNIGVLD
jgi:hypothetical protein